MSLKCGIVGLPNVGKSTLFNALTKAGIAAENYPFCTIEPNVGIVEVPDPRLEQLAGIVKPQKRSRTSRRSSASCIAKARRRARATRKRSSWRRCSSACSRTSTKAGPREPSG